MRIFILIFSLFSLLFTSFMHSKEDDFCEEFKDGMIGCSCKKIRGGVEYCAAIQKISPDGEDQIIVNDRLRNLSKEPVSIPKIGFLEDLYFIDIIDSEGNRLLSNKEIAEIARRKNPQMPITDWPIMSARSAPFRELKNQEVLKSVYTLSASYNLTPNVPYTIKLGRKINANDTREDMMKDVLTLKVEIADH